ncbi:VIT family protein [Leuconostoc holzapfelii]|uniref:VIT family protein n=1 Tax=Leuconostoc holzapfelii TaxID=434464 RepID=A0ABT2NVE4_9LACO|nr:VIT family protein [Leuconostoc holzapfelii]MCT8389349.1 VIT family protein [Leuconostoc holzapfelii]
MANKDLQQRNNLIRAGVMGANDGIVSVSGIILGVAGATSHTGTILLAGFAGMLAGTVSMAMGEYVSVSSQHDAQEKVQQDQKQALATDYATEFAFVKEKYVASGISPTLAQQATQEMMAKDALTTTVRERYGFTPTHELSAGGAAIASMISFPIGALLPMLAIGLTPLVIREWVTFFAVILALLLTGYAAAALNGADKNRSMVRNVMAGVFTMAVTFAIGSLFR